MGSRVAQCPAAICFFKRQELNRTVLVENRREVFRFAIDLGSQHLLGQAVADLFHKIQNAYARFHFADRAVFHGNLQHAKPS